MYRKFYQNQDIVTIIKKDLIGYIPDENKSLLGKYQTIIYSKNSFVYFLQTD